MSKLIATIKAIITRVLFGTHGFIAIWQVARNKENPIYWYFCVPIGLLFVEGLFTLAIKKNQEWRWFCPSVFLYLSSVVPAIWLLELDKIERRVNFEKVTGELNLTAIGADLKKLDKLLGVHIKLPNIQVDPSMWITLIEQFLMLILIVGRWMLPKGDLTRDQLSQLLLVYIGTAADIIEFFDSYKDNTIASEKLLVFLTLGIWSWSLLQFTIVLSATRSRKPRGGGSAHQESQSNTCCCGCCCSIDVWGIALNIVLQDAPFLAFRLLIIMHYNIISYMNVFFTCKNTLVILLQLYRLYVVHTENRKSHRLKKRAGRQARSRRRPSGEWNELNDIYTISKGRTEKTRRRKRNAVHDIIDDDHKSIRRAKKSKQASTKKDTGYSTASDSDTSCSSKSNDEEKSGQRRNGKTKSGHRSDGGRIKAKGRTTEQNEWDRKRVGRKQHSERAKRRRSSSEETRKERKPQKKDKKTKDMASEEIAVESQCSLTDHYQVVNEKKHKGKRNASTSSSNSTEY